MSAWSLNQYIQSSVNGGIHVTCLVLNALQWRVWHRAAVARGDVPPIKLWFWRMGLPFGLSMALLATDPIGTNTWMAPYLRASLSVVGTCTMSLSFTIWTYYTGVALYRQLRTEPPKWLYAQWVVTFVGLLLFVCFSYALTAGMTTRDALPAIGLVGGALCSVVQVGSGSVMYFGLRRTLTAFIQSQQQTTSLYAYGNGNANANANANARSNYSAPTTPVVAPAHPTAPSTPSASGAAARKGSAPAPLALANVASVASPQHTKPQLNNLLLPPGVSSSSPPSPVLTVTVEPMNSPANTERGVSLPPSPRASSPVAAAAGGGAGRIHTAHVSAGLRTLGLFMAVTSVGSCLLAALAVLVVGSGAAYGLQDDAKPDATVWMLSSLPYLFGNLVITWYAWTPRAHHRVIVMPTTNGAAAGAGAGRLPLVPERSAAGASKYMTRNGPASPHAGPQRPSAMGRALVVPTQPTA